MNRQQAAFLPGAHLSPARVLHITVPEDVCFKRIAVRKYDPVTGVAYYGPPANVTIRQRLRQDKMDKPEIVKKRFEIHAKNIADVETCPRSTCTRRPATSSTARLRTERPAREAAF